MDPESAINVMNVFIQYPEAHPILQIPLPMAFDFEGFQAGMSPADMGNVVAVYQYQQIAPDGGSHMYKFVGCVIR